MILKTFIDRPILSAVISIVIVIVGIIGLVALPIEQYPSIATPTVSVSATYNGANAETVQNSVIVPLEEAINGVEDMIYMTSEASNNGSASIKVYFKQGTDPDMAAVNVQNRVSQVSGKLPTDVTKSGVSVSKQQSSQIVIFNLYSSDDKYDDLFLSNYININLVPRILRINGVGGVNVLGADYSIRIWLNPTLMAQYGLVPSDIADVLDEQNIESPTGTFGENSEKTTFQYSMKYRGRYETPEEFGNLVIRSSVDGKVLRLKDVAKIELGADDYTMVGAANGHPGATCMVMQTAGSNAREIAIEMEQLLEDIEKELPSGIKVGTVQNVRYFLDASIGSVVQTLFEAMLLVILVVYIFLQNIRLTLIPMISMIVAIVGTFAALYLIGFSLNLLTLFALVLSIGTVVDDAIIVVEAVQAKIDSGYKSAYKATLDGMNGIISPVIVSTLVFMAVFIPVSFLGGTSGVFFKQFGITMAVSVAISAINALTLSPALCALLIRPKTENSEGKKSFQERFSSAFNTAFETMSNRYAGGVKYLLKRKWIAGTVLIVAVALLVVSMSNTKTGLVPDEDQGVIFVNVSTSPGSTLHQTTEIMNNIENAIKDIPQIDEYSKVVGYGMLGGQVPTTGMILVRLKSWDERKDEAGSIDAVMSEIYKRTAHIKNGEVYAMSPPMIIGYGTGDGFELYTQDKSGGSISDFYDVTQDFIAELNKRPEIGMAYSAFDIKYPQYSVEVDAAKCKRAGVSPNTVLNTLSGYYGGSYSSDINRFSKVYRVMVQASPEYRLDTESLNNIFVKTSEGMAPIAQFITLTKDYGAENISRFNMFNSISINGSPAEGYSTGDAIQAVKETAEKYLPSGYGYEFGGMTREESGSSSNTVIIMALCIVFIYLILSALYESFLIPLAVILSVPIGLMGSFFFTWIAGLENNIYLQTGVIMLIGLLSKTAILITELAQEHRKEGMPIFDAALKAAKERLRPILMTALTMIVGLLPLVFASGAGANGNISLGVGTVAGMTIGTLALLFITPTLFMVMQSIQEKIPQRKKQ